MNAPEIEISVEPAYIAEQSRPEEQHYVYAYTVTISNRGQQAAQLLSRHWLVTDANEEVQEVRGLGVVGEHPRLEPGGEYSYTSGVVLPTETGTMKGSYQMRTENGEEFETPIPTFALAPPEAIH